MKSTLFRLTRSAYRRKLITFGVSVFASIAMMASGFAAWVLSQDAQKDDAGQIEVAVIEDANIEITDITFEKDSEQQDIKNFSFEPLKDDDKGRVRWDGESSENLDLVIGWTVTNYQSATKHYVEFLIPEAVNNAIKADYLVAPADFTLGADPREVDGTKYYVATYEIGANLDASETTDGKKLTYEVKPDDTDPTIKTLECELTIAFKWGTKFGGENPSHYYDNTEAGKAVSLENVQKELETFRATVCGKTYEEYTALSKEDQAALPAPSYKLFVIATVQ